MHVQSRRCNLTAGEGLHLPFETGFWQCSNMRPASVYFNYDTVLRMTTTTAVITLQIAPRSTHAA